jgi:hypothetical protein
VQPVAVDMVMLDTQQADGAEEQPEQQACELWCCSFCGAECSSAEVEQSCCGSVQVRPAQDEGVAAPCSVDLQVGALLGSCWLATDKHMQPLGNPSSHALPG